MLGRTRRIHFVGVGGIGMSGIAELLANLGYEVSGSDMRRSSVTDRLETLGVTVSTGHDALHVGNADVVVISSAIADSNPEVVDARRRRIPVIPRAEMLAELMRLRYGIAIAGAHGKTTTTSMVALVLERAGLDPTAVIGGRLSAFGSNARLGQGDYVVAEADESDRSFLKLSPSIAVITNIDREHMESYGSWENLQEAFADFANKVPFYGAVVACSDDGPVRALLPRITRRVITYGFPASSHRARLPGAATPAMKAFPRSPRTVSRSRRSDRAARFHSGERADARSSATLRLSVPGRHNLLNALAAVAVGLETGVRFAEIAAALEEFRGAERRFERRGEAGGVLVVDDYGHHPTEIAAVIAAARAGVDRRIVVVFQPHRFTRTRDLLAEFGHALAAADEVVLTDIYPAGEAPIAGITVDVAGADRPRDRHLSGARGQASRRSTGGRGGAREERGSRYHAGCRIDRKRGRSHPRRHQATPATEGVGDMSVRAPAEKNFQRARVKPGRRRRGWRAHIGWRHVARVGAVLLVGYAAYRAFALVVTASPLQVSRIAVRGNVRLSSGEVETLTDGAARRQHSPGRSRGLPQEAAGVALGRRRGAAARAAGHGRGLHLGAAAGRPVPARRRPVSGRSSRRPSSTSSGRNTWNSICRSSTASCAPRMRRGRPSIRPARSWPRA